jgi:uncharacterized protein YutE (UPF0331/DUF86 family)
MRTSTWTHTRRTGRSNVSFERTLHLVIETCMDLADHIVADRRLGVPETAGATFDYTRLDPAIVLNVLRTNLVDVERFRDAIIAAI